MHTGGAGENYRRRSARCTWKPAWQTKPDGRTKNISVGKLYEARKNTVGNHNERNEDGTFQCTQNGNNGVVRVSEQIADEQNVGKNTVLRAEKFSQGIDAIREVSSETADSILRGETKVTKQDVSMVAKAKPEERKRIVQQIEKGEKITPVAVPDKIVNKPENKYTGGGTAEDMKSLLCFSANFLRRSHQSSSISADSPSASSTHEASYFTRPMMALQTGQV